jgi:NADH:ubiquinone oxidoreductase subunit F (NADH-binding)
MAPASADDVGRPRIAVRSRRPIVLERLACGAVTTLADYEQSGGLAGLKRALELGPDLTIAEIEKSELRGRGGAGFPTGRKWRTAAVCKSSQKYVVANLDEGDPGAYIDRVIAEEDPFALIEGLAIAAFAVGASRGYVYVRCEYPAAIRRLADALRESRQRGLLGPRVLGSSVGLDVELVIGRGSYACGEETSLLNSIEGKRPVARMRPPYVAVRGLYGQPTVVNNVETLANAAWILRHGAGAFRSLGIAGSAGTKVLSLNSLFQRPGLYEVEFGLPLRDVVEELGGGLKSGLLKGLLIGGPLAGVIPPALLGTPLGFEELRAIGASVGHGGVIAFDEHTSISQLVHHVFAFGAAESCGLCTPCRLGTRRIERSIADGARKMPGRSMRREEWRQLIDALRLASLCGLGTGLAEFAESIERYYAEELQRCFK